jgi:hypothetical protein
MIDRVFPINHLGGERCSLPGGIIAARRCFDHENMNVCFHLAPARRLPVELLLRHCLVLGAPGRRRPPAKVRLEEALGPEFARQLVTILTVGSRG